MDGFNLLLRLRVIFLTLPLGETEDFLSVEIVAGTIFLDLLLLHYRVFAPVAIILLVCVFFLDGGA